MKPFSVFVCSIKPQANPTKSLLEIQDEQARQLERERQKREENQQQAAKVSRWSVFLSKCRDLLPKQCRHLSDCS